MVFDNIDELYKIHKIYPKANLVLRIYALDKTARFLLSKKYGAHENEWKQLFVNAKKLNLNISGISFHIGSGAKNPAAFDKALKDTRKCYNLAKQYGFNINLIDIGGGFSKNTLENFSKIINKSKNKYLFFFY